MPLAFIESFNGSNPGNLQTVNTIENNMDKVTI